VLHKHGSPSGVKEANEFAAASLMPSENIKALGRVNPTLENLVAIKKKWMVSIVAVAVRLHALSLILDWHYRPLCIEISWRGWRTSEPFRARNATSQVWQKVLAALRGINISFQEFTRSLNVPADELDKFVFGLEAVGLPASELRRAT
jgi:Zn-dependent peptidase ImmA (M78 family)